jgi:zinc-ribbon domain
VQSVDHLCHHCNATVEDGVPFCPKCGAPQIRVAGAEDDEAVTPPLPPGTPGDIQPPAQPVYPDPSAWGRAPAQLAGLINWRVALPGAALAGLSGGVITLFLGRYLIVLILALLLAGAVTVRLYRRRTKSVIRPATGAKLGAFAGLFSFLIDALAVVAMFVLERPSVQQNMRDALDISSRNADPQSVQIMQNLIERMNTPGGMATICIVIIVFLFGICMVFTALGGVLGAALFGKDRNVA